MSDRKHKKERYSSDKTVIEQHLGRMDTARIGRALQDPRVAGRCEWGFGYLMEVLVGGMLVGAKNLRDVETFSEIYDERVPDSTLHDLMVQIVPSPLEVVIARQVKEAKAAHELDEYELPFTMVSVDGKHASISDAPVGDMSQKRTSASGESEYHNRVLRAMLVSSKVKPILGQRMIGSKTSEAPEFLPFIDRLRQLYGPGLLEVVRVDAGITSKENADGLVERGMDYFMAVKGNHGMLYDLMRAQLGPISEPDSVQVEIDGKHRIERQLFRLSLQDGIAAWSHARQIFLVRSCTIDSKGVYSQLEERYFITSLTTDKLSHHHVFVAVRNHWALENNGNWRFDTLWNEDYAPWCNRALQLVGLLRIFAYNTLARLMGRRLRSAKRRYLRWSDLADILRAALVRLRGLGILNAHPFVPHTL